jgi:glycosyltransferase involved in cell wall biosynthesis
MKYSVVIATYNRAKELAETLDGLAHLRTTDPWEVIVADNNSSDRTRQVVDDAAATFPAPLHYVFEGEQGKAAALNTAIRLARGEIIAFTDDDALVEPDWLDQAGAALADGDAAYVGGPVLPRWEKAPPRWLPDQRTRLWAVIALLDYGRQIKEFGQGIGWPLGVNMAVRSDVFHTHNIWWDNRYDRVGNSLRGQGQREWCLRLRAAGLRGFYAPEMLVHHLVPADRLVKPYFRRWFYWFGISRAIMYAHHGLDMEAPDERTFDFGAIPHIAGVPRYMFRGALYHVRETLRHRLLQHPPEAFEHELMLCFFAGVLRQRWVDRNSPIGQAVVEAPARNPASAGA